MNSTPPNLNDLKLTGLRKILIETPFGVVEAALDLAELATAKIPINPETNYPYEIYNSIDYGAILQAVKVASKSHDLFQFMTDAYRDYGAGSNLEENYYEASNSYIKTLYNIFDFALKDLYVTSLKLILPPFPGQDAFVFLLRNI